MNHYICIFAGCVPVLVKRCFVVAGTRSSDPCNPNCSIIRWIFSKSGIKINSVIIIVLSNLAPSVQVIRSGIRRIYVNGFWGIVLKRTMKFSHILLELWDILIIIWWQLCIYLEMNLCWKTRVLVIWLDMRHHRVNPLRKACSVFF